MSCPWTRGTESQCTSRIPCLAGNRFARLAYRGTENNTLTLKTHMENLLHCTSSNYHGLCKTRALLENDRITCKSLPNRQPKLGFYDSSSKPKQPCMVDVNHKSRQIQIKNILNYHKTARAVRTKVSLIAEMFNIYINITLKTSEICQPAGHFINISIKLDNVCICCHSEHEKYLAQRQDIGDL